MVYVYTPDLGLVVFINIWKSIVNECTNGFVFSSMILLCPYRCHGQWCCAKSRPHKCSVVWLSVVCPSWSVHPPSDMTHRVGTIFHRIVIFIFFSLSYAFTNFLLNVSSLVNSLGLSLEITMWKMTNPIVLLTSRCCYCCCYCCCRRRSHDCWWMHHMRVNVVVLVLVDWTYRYLFSLSRVDIQGHRKRNPPEYHLLKIINFNILLEQSIIYC